MGLLLAVLCAASALAESNLVSHNFTVGATALLPASGWKTSEYDPGPAVSASYGLRLHRYVQVEAGYTGGFPRHLQCGRDACLTERKRVSLLDYGLRGILPLHRDRVQLSAGVGGGYIWNDLGSSNSYLNETLFQYSGRASFAVGPARRYRLGTTLRLWRDLGRPTEQWFVVSGDFTWSLGR